MSGSADPNERRSDKAEQFKPADRFTQLVDRHGDAVTSRIFI
jgi:hypothetical protein